MSTSADMTVERREIVLDGITLSYLHAGAGRPVLLVHTTFWSRVWEPVLPELASAGYAVFALDFPGFGASGGRLTRDGATVPALARWARRFLNAVNVVGPVTLGGHDIGGAVAQHLAATDPSVERLILMNSVLYDSWPVPAVERFRDPAGRRRGHGAGVVRGASPEPRQGDLSPA